MRNAMWVGGGITGMGEIPMLGVKEKGIAKVIQKLFANNEQGFFYDPNDLSSMYQDVAGTVPVTAAGQPVGLMLDKSGGLIIGSNISAIPSASKTVDGNQTDYLINNATYANKWYVVEFDVLSVASQPHSSIAGALRFYFDRSRIDVGHSKLLILANSSGQISLTGATPSRYSIANITVKNISGNHAYQSTSASRPILRQNAVTGANYLEFDGSDDFLQTSNIDFTATDEVTVVAAIGKLSDTASYRLVYELSANAETRNGSFRMMAPGTASEKGIVFGSRGTSQTSANIPDYPAPINLLTTMQSSIKTPHLKARVNGIQVSNITTSQGTGNYGNYPLYICRRGGTTFPFLGHIYGLIGVGRLTTASEIAAIEKELAKRTGVALNV